MKLASIVPVLGLALSLVDGFISPSVAQESRWGSPDEDTVKLITAAEAKWASSACSPQPDLKDVIADDFQGTSTSGQRYGKEEAITADTKSLSRACQLGEVKVRFFGDSMGDSVRSGKQDEQRGQRQGDEALPGLDRHVAKARREVADCGRAGHNRSV